MTRADIARSSMNINNKIVSCIAGIVLLYSVLCSVYSIKIMRRNKPVLVVQVQMMKKKKRGGRIFAFFALDFVLDFVAVVCLSPYLVLVTSYIY